VLLLLLLLLLLLQVWEAEKHDFDEITENELHKGKRYLTLNAFANFW